MHVILPLMLHTVPNTNPSKATEQKEEKQKL